MPTSRRSTAGCIACKTRHKKCDETKPQCRRCLSSGISCIYDYVSHRESDKRPVNIIKPPRNIPELSTSNPEDTPVSFPEVDNTSTAVPSTSRNPAIVAHSVPPESEKDQIYPTSNLITPWGVTDYSPLSLPRVSSPSPFALGSTRFLSPIQQHCSVTRTYNELSVISTPTSHSFAWIDEDGEDWDESDPEGVRSLLCKVPNLDRNVEDNTLPFVLHCYSQWAVARVFEPLKMVHIMRDQVFAQFSSDDTRKKTILIANVMGKFGKDLKLDDITHSILNYLVLDVQKSGSTFMSMPPSPISELDRQNAMHVLNSMLEIFSLQTSTQSIAHCLHLMDCAAPVFRRACSEPQEQPINLFNTLQGSNPNLQHFATMDIAASITTGVPTYFRYEVPFSLELCERMYEMQDTVGLQWLHGLPDQFVMLFAWINSLHETPGASGNSGLIAWIERNVFQIRIATSESGDPLLRIGRMVVRECWRFAVLIYLYMVLCKVNAYDPRVIKAQKGFMRLVRGVKPARNPDAYLFVPTVIAGVATLDEPDRDMIRQRILGVPECAEKGTTGNNAVLLLENIWARTRDAGRPAVWSDLRVATFRVSGK